MAAPRLFPVPASDGYNQTMTEMLGKYELRHVLGKGAMGTVYEGYDPIIDRRVAIKTVKLPDAELSLIHISEPTRPY